MKSLKEVSLDERRDQFNVWTTLPIVVQNHLHEKLSRREILVSELQFSIVRKELIYQRKLCQLHKILRQSVLSSVDYPPKYIRRQGTLLLARLKRMSESVVRDLEKDFFEEDSIVLNLHRILDLIYRSTSQEFASTLLAYCDILSELRCLTYNNSWRKSGKNLESNQVQAHVEKILAPIQRLAELKSTLLKICDDLREQRQLAKAHRALDNVAGILDSCYECLTSLHGVSYVVDIDNLLDLSWKPSSLKYNQHRADYLIQPKQTILSGESNAKPPLPVKNLCSHNMENETYCSRIEALYDLVEVPLDFSYSSPPSSLLHKSFECTPLYQAISSEQIRQVEEKGDAEVDITSQRTLWGQIEPVINSGLLEKLKEKQRELMEAKFEIISSEVSYLKSLCVLITIFIESDDIQRLITHQDMNTLFSNITEVKEVSEKFLDDVTASLSRDVLMSDICSLIRVHAVTTFRAFVRHCSCQIAMHNTFEKLVTENDDLVGVLQQLESSSACQGYSLISFLTLPLQRVTRLPLLMQAIIKYLPVESSLERREATEALKALQQLVKDCNDAVSKPRRKLSIKKSSKKLIWR